MARTARGSGRWTAPARAVVGAISLASALLAAFMILPRWIYPEGVLDLAEPVRREPTGAQFVALDGVADGAAAVCSAGASDVVCWTPVRSGAPGAGLEVLVAGPAPLDGVVHVRGMLAGMWDAGGCGRGWAPPAALRLMPATLPSERLPAGVGLLGLGLGLGLVRGRDRCRDGVAWRG
jgi:hypothetical protein